MANIYSVKDGGDYHWDDPNAWVGGVVPGPIDTAYIQHTFTQINSGSGIHHWEGTVDSIRVDNTADFPDSGSFYTWLNPSAHKIKIDYQSKDSTYFYTCSIDQSYQAWEAGDSGPNIGIISNDAAVSTKSTTIYISGSADIHAQEIVVEDQAEFVIKDQATLRLDCSTRDARILLRDGVLKMLDETTYIITGSVERGSTGVIYQQNYQYAQVLISGSSDLRTRTTVNGDTVVDAGSIPVNSTIGFEAGDIISVYDEDNTSIQATLNGNNIYEPYDYDTSGSVYPYVKRYVTRDQNETVEVVGKDSTNLYVKRFFGKEGKVIASSNTFTKDKFQRLHGKSKSRFTGTRTAITVRSGHNSFKVGDKLVVGSNIYTVLEAADKLIPYKSIDFSQGAGLEDFYVDEYIGSGSGDSYLANSHMASGSALYVDPNQIGVGDYRKSFFLKNMKLRDVKVTLSGSLVDENGTYESSRMVGISIGDTPYIRDRSLYFYARYGYSRARFAGCYQANFHYGSEVNNYQYFDTRNSTNLDITPSTTHPFTTTIDALRENTSYYYNGEHTGDSLGIKPSGAVAIHLRSAGARIHSLNIEEYVQELVLDTSNSISIGSTVHEGGTLVPHSVSQSIVKTASKIVSLRGYRDLAAEYEFGVENPEIIPTFWSNGGNRTQYQRSDTTTDRARYSQLFYSTSYRAYVRLNSSGNSYLDFNLGAEVTFDAIGFAQYYAYTGAYPKGIGFEVSNDGTNWTVVRAQADDTRLGVSSATNRIYTFNEVTARFLRIRVNGASNTGNNYINKVAIYHFNGRGSSIELNNTSDINVGDQIRFMTTSGNANQEYDYARTNNWRSALQAGTYTEDDIPGGPTSIYTITAKSGNVITLDKLVETEYLTPDMLVIKVNRSLTVKGHNYLPAGMYYSDSSSALSKVEIFNASALMLGNRSLEQMYFYRNPFGPRMAVNNCSFYYIEVDNIYNRGGMEWKNNVIGNSTVGDLVSTGNMSDSVIHGNFIEGFSSIRLYTHQGQNVYRTGNFYMSYRYGYMSNSYTDIPSATKTVIRGNYFRFNDYMNVDWGLVHGRNSLNIEMYANVMHQEAGYFRPYIASMEPWTNGSRVEWPELYPPVKRNGYIYRNSINSIVYTTVGTDRLELLPVYGVPHYSNRNMLIDDSRRAIIKKKNVNEYDVYAIHLNRTGGTVLGSSFLVRSAQQVKLVAKLTYKVPPTQIDYPYGSALGRSFNLMLIGPDNKVITVERLPYHTDYTKHTFEYTFDAEPGQYVFKMEKRHGAYGFHIMTYNDASFTILGENPDTLYVGTNNFSDHLILGDRDKFLGSHYNYKGIEPLQKTGQRTTVKFRKIKF